jgi:hypothetical protein
MAVSMARKTQSIKPDFRQNVSKDNDQAYLLIFKGVTEYQWDL